MKQFVFSQIKDVTNESIRSHKDGRGEIAITLSSHIF